jgi:hypothetical protein
VSKRNTNKIKKFGKPVYGVMVCDIVPWKKYQSWHAKDS